jgi:DNA polymerase
MTAAEKGQLARFLDLALDTLRDGYRSEARDYQFEDDPPAASPAISSAIDNGGSIGDSIGYSRGDSLEKIAAEVRSCAACGLCRDRTNAVPGEGAERPLVMVIGEGPGADEDATGRPFVGRAGQLLDKMLASISLARDRNCFIANAVKCRPPQNRDPGPEETAACAPFLERQIALLKPRAILCAGRIAARLVLHTEEGVGRLRGRFGEYPSAFEIMERGTLQSAAMAPVPVLPTYHPSALLRNEEYKRPAFEDLKLLMTKLAVLDSGYALEAKPLLDKYSGQDPAFAARLREFQAGNQAAGSPTAGSRTSGSRFPV